MKSGQTKVWTGASAHVFHHLFQACYAQLEGTWLTTHFTYLLLIFLLLKLPSSYFKCYVLFCILYIKINCLTDSLLFCVSMSLALWQAGSQGFVRPGQQ